MLPKLDLVYTCKVCKRGLHPLENVRMINGYDWQDGIVHWACTPDYIEYEKAIAISEYIQKQKNRPWYKKLFGIK